MRVRSSHARIAVWMEERSLTRRWYATRTVGAFKWGHYYDSAQLGVVGRMAVKAGLIIDAGPAVIHTEKAPKKAVRPRKSRAKVSTKGWADGEASVPSGGSAEVRDEDGS